MPDFFYIQSLASAWHDRIGLSLILLLCLMIPMILPWLFSTTAFIKRKISHLPLLTGIEDNVYHDPHSTVIAMIINEASNIDEALQRIITTMVDKGSILKGLTFPWESRTPSFTYAKEGSTKYRSSTAITLLIEECTKVKKTVMLKADSSNSHTEWYVAYPIQTNAIFQSILVFSLCGQTTWYENFLGFITPLLTSLSVRSLRLKELAAQAATPVNPNASHLLTTMSHELRTPLNGIIGMLELFENTNLNEKQQKYTKLANRCSEDLLNLIQIILDVAKIKAGKRELHLETILFDNLLTAIKASLEKISEGNSRHLSIVHANTIPRQLTTDLTMLLQILEHLMTYISKVMTSDSITIHIDLPPNDHMFYNATLKYKTPLSFKVTAQNTNESTKFCEHLSHCLKSTRHRCDQRHMCLDVGLSLISMMVTLLNGEMHIVSNEESNFGFVLVLPTIEKQTT